MRFNRYDTQGLEFPMAVLMPTLAFVFLAIIGGMLMTRFRFNTRSRKSRLSNDFIKSGQWWGGLFVVSFSMVLVWYLGLFQVSIWTSQLEYRPEPFVLPHIFLERVRSYLRIGGLLLFSAGVLLGGLGQVRFIVRYRGRVEYLVKRSRD
jgi:magnesium-transporting ATPase (P-type)